MVILNKSLSLILVLFLSAVMAPAPAQACIGDCTSFCIEQCGRERQSCVDYAETWCLSTNDGAGWAAFQACFEIREAVCYERQMACILTCPIIFH